MGTRGRSAVTNPNFRVICLAGAHGSQRGESQVVLSSSQGTLRRYPGAGLRTAALASRILVVSSASSSSFISLSKESHFE